MALDIDHPTIPATDAPSTSSDNGSDQRSIAGAALVVMFFFVLSRVTGLAREIVIGAQFGTSAALDAYLAAFRLPDILFQLVAGGALGSAFIPTFAAYWVRNDRRGAWLLFSRVLNGITLLLVCFAALAAVGAEPITRQIIAPGFSPEQQSLTAALMRWMLLGTVVFGASGLVMGALNAVYHFLLPAAAPVFYNLAIIVGAWLLAPRYGVYGLVAGVLIGALGHLLIQLPGLRREQARYTLSLSWQDAGVREVARLMGPRVLGLFFVQMHFLVNTILASRLSPGSLSALNYAWLIMLLPQGVFAQSVATAAFPTFSAQIAGGRQDAMRSTFGGILRLVLFLTVPAAVGLLTLGVPLIGVLLQRGEFSAESTRMVYTALRFYALGLVAHGVVEITVRAFYALHDTLIPVMVGIGAMVVNIGLSLWLVGRLSFGGLALANSSATTVEMVVLLWLLARRLQGIDGRRLLASALRIGLAAAVMGGVLWWWVRAAPGLTASLAGLQTGITVLVGFVLAATVYGVVTFVLGSEELQPALAFVARRLRR